MPADSNWNTPPASSLRQHLVGRHVIQRQAVEVGRVRQEAMARCKMVSVVRPRKSNFTKPACSTYFIEYWVTSVSDFGSR